MHPAPAKLLRLSASGMLAALLIAPGSARASLSERQAPDAANDCVVRSDAPLRAKSIETKDGYLTHEAWIGAPGPQQAVRKIWSTVDQTLGVPEVPDKRNPDASLARGLIGATVDHYAQAMVFVVDPDKVDAQALESKLNATAQLASGHDSVSRVRVQVRAGCFSAQQLVDANRVILGRSWHPRAKETTFTASLDAADSRIHATFRRGDTEVAEALKVALGDRVVIAYGQPRRLSRDIDGEPHYGGAAIGPAPWVRNCTAGFTVVLPDGLLGSVTSDHCYPDNEDLWSGDEFYGRTQAVSGYPTWDMMRIRPVGERFDNRIHVDPCCPSVRTVTGRGNARVDELVCLSGMSTRAVCGVRVVNTNAVVCDAAGCTPGLMHGVKPGVRLTRDGDSGGPVYVRPNSTDAYIRGLIVGGGGGPDDDVFAEHVSQVESHLGVRVATS